MVFVMNARLVRHSLLAGTFVLAFMAVEPAQAQRLRRHGSLPVATRDGKRIFFVSDRDGKPQIYRMNVDGSSEQRVSDLTTFDFAPDPSADGKWIVFSSFLPDDSPTKIILMRDDGSDRRVVATGHDARWPRVSPDGRQIAFTYVDDKGRNTIALVNADGSGLRPFPTGLVQSWDPEWSPDGHSLLFGAFPADTKNPQNSTSTIYVSDLSGRNRRKVATYHGVIQLPRWAPDEKRVAFQTYTGGGDANIIVIDPASGKSRTITHHDHPYLDETPSWLPDGRILFQSNRTGQIEVWVMNADGSGQRQLTSQER